MDSQLNVFLRGSRWLAVKLIRGYQLAISPLFPPTCRYYPTCSAYAVEAVEIHGVFKGGWLAIKRVSRCHPLHEGGFDPVPGSPLANEVAGGLATKECCSKEN